MGVSKQAHAQHRIQLSQAAINQQAILEAIAHSRLQHPGMGLKKLYHKLKPVNLGRDQFIALAMAAGLGGKVPKNHSRTTFSTKTNRYSNLLKDLLIDDINQVWVSDITYLWVVDRFYYLTFIMDLYSRRILGYKAAASLSATANLEALRQAIHSRKAHPLTRLIHHSDKGSQYIYSPYIELLETIGAQVSLCNTVYENAHSERLNGIIKNEYLQHRCIKNLADVDRHLAHDVKLYNQERPHMELNFMSPIEYEQALKSVAADQRTKMRVFVDEQTIKRQKFANQLVLF